ncbi:hypothetical protein SAMN05660420_00233 [Desulfuromusa kysingii]|uniref:DUF3820 family protein n=1 Tax=Desulfuromusa kysingii TaxID=37625 RepID=A0A1H3VR52_9BACT|nr:DUF3820 family protein [Desulfuromusa kysingii]SDZ77257.1 hypothetical protein SAMN05660420_00233 [Desulfuromusa kysingii]
MPEEVFPDPQRLRSLVTTRMPYGKHAGRLLLDLPEPYVVWMVTHQLPQGLLGEQLLEMYEIKVNGLEGLLRPMLTRENL